jgi:hypothetical protein
MVKRLSIFLVCIFLLATLVEAFHHHNNGAAHPECPICIAAHHQSNAGYTSPPTCEIRFVVSEPVYVRSVLALVSKIYFAPAQNRAPPA